MSDSTGCGGRPRRRPGFQALAAAALLCAMHVESTLAQAPTAWTNTSGGVWSDSASWSNGVPNGNAAVISVTGASYAVTYDAPATAFRDLTISNSAGFTSTLNIASTAFAPVGNVLLSSGAVVNVNSGGVWSPVLSSNVSLEVKAGAALNIAGGAILYTNAPLTNDVSLKLSDSGGGATSVLNLTSGQLELRTTNVTTYTWYPLSIGWAANKSGIMNISGGKCTIQTDGNGSSVGIGTGAGGRGYLNISGGELVITNVQGGTYQGPYSYIGYSSGYGEVNISGAGKFTKENNKELWIGRAGEGHLNVNGGTASINGLLLIGCRGVNGTGIVEIIAGSLLVKGFMYLAVEAWAGTQDNTGKLNVYGGTTTIRSTVYAGWSSIGRTNRIGRITVTNGLLNTTNTYVGLVDTIPGGQANGELNLSGSGIISNSGNLYVGSGTGAVAVFNQTGGRYNQSGGVMYVGNNGGDGTFNMIGSQGILTVPALAATTSASRISFDLGTNGAGAVTVSGAVSISTNASLDITVTNYDWSANGLTVDLISYGALTGAFGATNVTIVGAVGGLDGGAILYGDGSNDKIRLQLNARPSGTIIKSW